MAAIARPGPGRGSPTCGCPGRSDLCFATTNRQTALRAIAPRCDAVVVIGSANSSNTVALVKVARAAGCRRVLRVNAPTRSPTTWPASVGVTAGASAPERLVEAVMAAAGPAEGVEEVHVTIEDEYFPPPPELRDLLRGMAAAIGLGLGAPAPVRDRGPLAADRDASAADALARLTG